MIRKIEKDTDKMQKLEKQNRELRSENKTKAFVYNKAITELNEKVHIQESTIDSLNQNYENLEKQFLETLNYIENNEKKNALYWSKANLNDTVYPDDDMDGRPMEEATTNSDINTTGSDSPDQSILPDKNGQAETNLEIDLLEYFADGKDDVREYAESFVGEDLKKQGTIVWSKQS
eukprot:UN33172